MKYLKKFEGISYYTNKKFWILPTDERFKDAMNKIGAGYTDYDFAIAYFRNRGLKYLIIYNASIKQKSIDIVWNYIGYNSSSIKYLESEGYENMGTVYIPQYELDMEKYNL